jgi:hypothetical protein
MCSIIARLKKLWWREADSVRSMVRLGAGFKTTPRFTSIIVEAQISAIGMLEISF